MPAADAFREDGSSGALRGGLIAVPLVHAAAMEKQSLTQGRGHKEMLRRVAAHHHGEDFNADVDNEYSYNMGVWCAKTAWACWWQASTDG